MAAEEETFLHVIQLCPPYREQLLPVPSTVPLSQYPSRFFFLANDVSSCHRSDSLPLSPLPPGLAALLVILYLHIYVTSDLLQLKELASLVEISADLHTQLSISAVDFTPSSRLYVGLLDFAGSALAICTSCIRICDPAVSLLMMAVEQRGALLCFEPFGDPSLIELCVRYISSNPQRFPSLSELSRLLPAELIQKYDDRDAEIAGFIWW